MRNLEFFTKSALLLKKNILPEREYYNVLKDGKNLDEAMSKKQDRVVNLNDNWLYKPCDDAGESIEDEFYDEYFIGREYEETSIPNNNLSGAYIKKVHVTENDSELECYFNITGISCSFYLWINGVFAGYNKEAKGASEIRISDYLQIGVNTIALLALKDEEEQTDSGIWGEMFLEFRPLEHIRSFKVKTEVDEYCENAAVTLSLDFKDEMVSTNYALIDPKGNVVIKDNYYPDEGAFLVPAPSLWNAEKPDLYTLVIFTSDETIYKRIGIFESEVKEECLYINHKKVTLSGTICGSELAHAQNKSQAMLILARIKQHNMNAIKLKDADYAPWLPELCMRMGIYLIEDQNVHTKDFMDWSDQQNIESFKQEKAPIKASLEIDDSISVSFTNHWDFKNTIDELYVETELFKGEQLLQMKKLYLLDVEPNQSKTVQLKMKPLEPGEYQLNLCYRQVVKTPVLNQGHVLGQETLTIEV